MKPFSIILGSLFILTLASCGDNERGRIYSSRDAEACKTLLFTCAPGRVPFFDNDGCGCELSGDDEYRRNINTRPEIYDDDSINPPDTYDTNPGLRNQDNNTQNNTQLNEDPINRDLDELQDRRLDSRD